MKKVYLTSLAFILLLFLSSCGGTRVEANYGQIVFSFPDEDLEYLPYTEIPSFTLEFEGVLNTATGISTNNIKTFSKNDDFLFSDIISNLLEEYREKKRLNTIILSQDEQFETKMNKLVINDKGEAKHDPQIMRAKDGEVFNEISYLSLENGLVFSISYRRFISSFEGEEKTYYAWQYRASIEMVLHYPVILHQKDEGGMDFLIVPTPPEVIYHISPSSRTRLKSFINDEDFLEKNFRRFEYPYYFSIPVAGEEFNLEENIEIVKEYYIRSLNGRTENGVFLFDFLGYSFRIDFEESAFEINIA